MWRNQLNSLGALTCGHARNRILLLLYALFVSQTLADFKAGLKLGLILLSRFRCFHFRTLVFWRSCFQFASLSGHSHSPPLSCSFNSLSSSLSSFTASVQIRRTKRLPRLVPTIHGENAHRAGSGLNNLPMMYFHRTRHIEVVQERG